jgi:hypothetical protein
LLELTDRGSRDAYGRVFLAHENENSLLVARLQ